MQWRPLTLLLCGIGVIYLASLIQDSPYPHPIKTYTSDSTRWRTRPDDVILSTVDDYLYVTTIRFEAIPPGYEGLRHGTGALKSGVAGSITQMRRPLRVFMQDHVNETKGTEDGWVQTFEHRLPGAISKVSTVTPSESGNNDIQFGAMYHVVENESSKHYIRIYYTAIDNTPGFKYKDIRMPGSTWISAFSLEPHEILYARDPDRYRFRTVSLPSDLTRAPHSLDAKEIILTESIEGDIIREFHQPRNTESHEISLCRIYSPALETYRVMTVDIHKTETAYYCNFTLVDNVTTPSQLAELRNEPSKSTWTVRQHQLIEHQVYSEEQVDYIGFADVSQFQQERARLNIPQPMFARSNDGKAIVFPFVQTQFLTLDYIDQRTQEDNGELAEFYDWLRNEVKGPYDAAITGIHVNPKGNMLAVWTDYNTIYIYKRGSANTQKMPRRKPSLLDRMDIWLDVSIPEDEDESSYDRHENGLSLPWKLRMAITPQEGELQLRPISSVKFWNATSNGRQSNYLLVALQNGGVNSYLVDEAEEYVEDNFINYVKTSWNLVAAMAMITAAFVLNEYRNHP